MIAQQEATPAYEEPVLLSSDIEEQTKRLDREILYLLNKLRSHPPPRAKNATANATNSSTASNTTTNKVGRNLIGGLINFNSGKTFGMCWFLRELYEECLLGLRLKLIVNFIVGYTIF